MANPVAAHFAPEMKWVTVVAEIADILPVVQTVKNLIDLFLRYYWKPEDPSKLPPLAQAYFFHFHQKNTRGAILMMIPGLGTLLGIMLFYSNHFKNSQEPSESYEVRTRREMQSVGIPQAEIDAHFKRLKWIEEQREALPNYFQEKATEAREVQNREQTAWDNINASLEKNSKRIELVEETTKQLRALKQNGKINTAQHKNRLHVLKENLDLEHEGKITFEAFKRKCDELIA